MTRLARMILIRDTAMWVIPKIYIYFMNSKLIGWFFQILPSVKYLHCNGSTLQMLATTGKKYWDNQVRKATCLLHRNPAKEYDKNLSWGRGGGVWLVSDISQTLPRTGFVGVILWRQHAVFPLKFILILFP